MNDRWITPLEASKILDIDDSTVRRWARRRLRGEASKLRYVLRQGGGLYVSAREISTIKNRP